MVEASVRVVAPDERRSELVEVLRSLKGPTEVSIGCHACRILQDADDAAVLTYHVQWDTREELEDHFRSERFRRLLPYIEMSVEPPEVDVSEVQRVGGIEFLVAALSPDGQTSE
jgi:quinol monooxygenase YgiN